MAKDLTDYGFEALTNPSDVEAILGQQKGTALLVVNSVCGCAAANARPGAKMSLAGEKKPDHLYTVFAGVDGEATAKAREFLLPYPPSSPSIALFKDGQLVHFLERVEAPEQLVGVNKITIQDNGKEGGLLDVTLQMVGVDQAPDAAAPR